MTDDDERDETEQDPSAAEARRTILDRRARFVAAALAGIATACGGETSGSSSPHPCLSLDASRATGGMNTFGSGGAPQVCLGAPPAGGTFGAGGYPASGGNPQPCLKMAIGGMSNVGGSPPAVDSGVDAADGAPSNEAASGLPLPCLSIIKSEPAKGGS